LAAWQKWFAQTWPDHPPAIPPVSRAGNIWKYEDLVRQLAAGADESASAENGAAVFLSASCANCHRCGDQGEGRAPDLTGVGQRLMRREIVRSLLYPSETIAAPYLSRTIVTTRGRVLSGRISPLTEPGKVVIVQPDARRIAVPHEEVDESQTIHASEMPEGLLESLTSQQIQDLFAFLLSGHEPQLARQPSEPKEPDADGTSAEPAATSGPQ
jgi:putative heme-binding domain-containing protein